MPAEGFRIASAWVEVKPDLTGFGEELRAKTDEAASRARPKVKVDADTTRASAEIDRAARNRRTQIKVDVDRSSLDRLNRTLDKLGGRGSFLGAAAGLTPALIPVAGAAAGAVTGIGVSFGAAATAAGLFGEMAKTTLDQTAKDAKKLSDLQMRLQVATTEAQKKHIEKQISAIESGYGRQYTALLKGYADFTQQWAKLSKSVTIPVLVPWIHDAEQGMRFLRPAVQPVADVFHSWGEDVGKYFSSAKGSAEVHRYADEFGRFSASQMRDIGFFVHDIAAGVHALGEDVAAEGAGFGTFGDHLQQWGAAFLDWSQSDAARKDVHDFLKFMRDEGPQVTRFLENAGGALAAFAPGLSSAGRLELRAISDFLGFLDQHLTPTEAKVIVDGLAGIAVGLKAVGLASTGLSALTKTAGVVGKILGFGGSSVGAAAGLSTAAGALGESAVALDAAAVKLGATGGAGRGLGGLNLGKVGPAEKIGVAGTGISALSAAAVAIVPVVATAAFAWWMHEHYDKPGAKFPEPGPERARFGPLGQQFPQRGGERTGPKEVPSHFAPGPGVVPAIPPHLTDTERHNLQWLARTYGIDLPHAYKLSQDASTNLNISWLKNNQAAENNRERLSAAAAVLDAMRGKQGLARRDMDAYTASLRLNGSASEQTIGARRQLISDLEKAGMKAGDATSLVEKLSTGIKGNANNLTVTHPTRRQLIGDLEAAGMKAGDARRDVDDLGTAVRDNGSSSNQAKSARAKLIADLVNAGADARDAAKMVDRFSASISRIPRDYFARLNMSAHGSWSVAQRYTGPSGLAPGTAARAGQAAGGLMRGPGGPTGDQIPAWLSDNEYVVRAAAVERYGADFFDDLNALRLAAGGIVPAYSGTGAASAAGLGAWAVRNWEATVGQMAAALESAVAKATGAAAFAGTAGRYAPGGRVRASRRAEQSAGLTLYERYTQGGLATVASILAEQRTFLRDIAKYFTGSHARWRDQMVDRQTRHLAETARRLAAVDAKISAARGYQQSVRSNLEGYAGLSALNAGSAYVGTAHGTTFMTGGQYLEYQLKQKLHSLKAFGGALKKLSAAHAPAALIRQAADLGPDAGLQFAQEILAGGPALMKQLSATEREIGRDELGISRGAASAVYEGRYMTGKHFLAALKAERHGLERLFRELGKTLGMEAARWFGVPKNKLPSFDTGGWLLPGQAGINTGRTPELMIPAGQFVPLAKAIAAELAPLIRAGSVVQNFHGQQYPTALQRAQARMELALAIGAAP